MKIYTVICSIVILIASMTTSADARVIGGRLDRAVAVYYFNRLRNVEQIFDHSGNRLHGNLFPVAELAWVSGRHCLSLNSNAANFWAENDDKPLSVSRSFSIVAWVKVPIGGNSFFIGITAYNEQNTDEGLQGGVNIVVQSDGDLVGVYTYKLTDGTLTSEVAQAIGRNVNDDQWHHVAYVVSGNAMKLYLNGTPIVNRSVTAHPPFRGTGTFISIGDDARGSVDNVAFFRNNLTTAQVKLIYTVGLPNVIGIAPVDPSGKAATTWAALKKR